MIERVWTRLRAKVRRSAPLSIADLIRLADVRVEQRRLGVEVAKHGYDHAERHKALLPDHYLISVSNALTIERQECKAYTVAYRTARNYLEGYSRWTHLPGFKPYLLAELSSDLDRRLEWVERAYWCDEYEKLCLARNPKLLRPWRFDRLNRGRRPALPPIRRGDGRRTFLALGLLSWYVHYHDFLQRWPGGPMFWIRD